MKQKTYTCIVCPKSCSGTLIIQENGSLCTEGFGCKNGERYAENEYRNPKRMLTTTVRITHAPYALLPVTSSQEISRTVFNDCLQYLYRIQVDAPIKEGEVIVSNILGTGVDIIAARSLEEDSEP